MQPTNLLIGLFCLLLWLLFVVMVTAIVVVTVPMMAITLNFKKIPWLLGFSWYHIKTLWSDLNRVMSGATSK